MQFLIESKDRSLSIVYKKSIIAENINVSLAVGDEVKFLWPENAKRQHQFTEKIVAENQNETVLFDAMESIKNTQKLEDKGPSKNAKEIEKRERGRLKRKYDDDDSNNPEGKKRKKAATMIEQDLLKHFSNSQPTEEKNNGNGNKWLVDAINNVKSELISDFDKAKEKAVSQLDFILSSVQSNEVAIPSSDSNLIDLRVTSEQGKRRSFGMPLTLEEDDFSEGKDLYTKCQSDKEDKSFTNDKDLRNGASKSQLDRSLNMIFNNSIFDSNDNILTNQNPLIEKTRPNVKSSYLESSDSDTSLPIENNKNQKSKDHDLVTLTSGESDSDLLDNVTLTLEKSHKSKLNEKQKARFIDEKQEQDVFVDSRPPNSKTSTSKKYTVKRRNIISSSDEDEETEKSIKTKTDKTSTQDEKKAEPKDEKNKWTLRYATKVDNTKELLKGSSVFVNVFEMRIILENCKKQTDLARALLKLVFTEKALQTCTRTGTKHKGRDKDVTVKPGLNKNGMEAILSFVIKYAEKQRWAVKDCQTIKRSIDAKLFEIKNKK